MNAVPRFGLRTKVIVCLFVAAGLVTVVSTIAKSYGAEPKLELTFEGYETNRNQRVAIYTVRNIGNAPGMYRGYGKKYPLYDFEHRGPDGEWTGRVLFCGTGLTDWMLLPGEQIRGEQTLFNDCNWRLGVRYTKPSFYDRLPRKVQALVPFAKKYGPFQTIWTPEIAGLPMLDPDAGALAGESEI